MSGAELLRDVVSWICLVGGSLFCIVGGIGLLRFPDFYSRIHATALTDTMGAGLMLVGLMFQSGWSLVTLKLLGVLAFLFITSPVAAHALVKAAFAHGVKVPEDDILTAGDDA